MKIFVTGGCGFIGSNFVINQIIEHGNEILNFDKLTYAGNLDNLKEVNSLLEKNTPTNPSKWAYYKAQAKKKFDVYPSAYANAWAAKQYKAAGGGWRKGK